MRLLNERDRAAETGWFPSSVLDTLWEELPWTTYDSTSWDTDRDMASAEQLKLCAVEEPEDPATDDQQGRAEVCHEGTSQGAWG